MKLLKRLMTLALTVFMVTALTACSSKPKVDPAVGYWKLVDMVDGDGKSGKEDVELLDSLGMYVTLEIAEDGKAVLDMFGETTEMTYADGKMTLGEEVIEITVDGTTLTMAENGQSLIFEKTEKPEE
ncbi:MAG: hypothetical protein IJJ24_06140 [Solobacterium sp.]|nr:hypothetical protein [Erysipelotrichaceae bacterium]MBQ1446656.1 hypothetical protein [Solobacterium sp.]MBQ2689955.1 hypothetical protein [Solobacterium sp.]MBQ6591478.1 hypothetical protein [Solobacterium sp.]MBR0478659.1 hypothetical protein [Solobacterium sp.]